ncbi:hypothetical protein OC834_005885 [Tilletia horrida]|nr:hypothetical protein OC834_005885 [Tilletia horrida]
MKKNSGVAGATRCKKGEEEEVRFMYAARGREQLVFNNGKTGNAYPPQWASFRTMATSITIEPPGSALIRSSKNTSAFWGELEKVGAQCLEETLGGEFFPKAERPLFIKGVKERDPGVTSDRTFDHDLLKGLKGNDFVYNSIPSVVVLDVEDMDEWEVSWHQAHLLPKDALWEVDCFLRVYVGKKVRVGFQLIPKSLVLHGQEEQVV